MPIDEILDGDRVGLYRQLDISKASLLRIRLKKADSIRCCHNLAAAHHHLIHDPWKRKAARWRRRQQQQQQQRYYYFPVHHQ